ALRGHQRDARVDQLLLRVEDVERGALADAGFLAYAVERDLRRGHLRLRGLDLRLRGLELTPRLHDGGARLVAGGVEIDPPLAEIFLVLPNQRVFATALIDRNGDLP